MDITGDLEDAGGIGALLVFLDHIATNSFFAAYDANGNVTGLIKPNLTVSAQYEYSPYGELLRATGPLSRINPLRWSTKFWDEETAAVYYGFRYYSPTSGRWLSSDPLEEGDGPHLLAFASSDPVNGYDSTGLTKGRKQKIKVSGFENATEADIRIEIERLKALKDPKLAQHIKKLEGQAKALKQVRKTANKFKRSKGKDQGGYIHGGALTAMAIVGAGLIADGLYSYLDTTVQVQNVREIIASAIGVEAGSTMANLFDFVKHVDSGDIASADLDAAVYAAERSEGGVVHMGSS